MDRQKKKNTERQTDGHEYKRLERQTDRQTDRWKGKGKDRQTDRHFPNLYFILFLSVPMIKNL